MEDSKRKVWLTVIVVVLFAFAGYRIFFGGTRKPQIPDEFTGYGVCLACGQEAAAVFRKEEVQPFHCQACGEDAVYLWWFCNDCGYRFVPELVREPGQPPRPTPFPYCTHCACNSVSGWDPDNPAHGPENDAKLPPWP